MSVLAQWCFAFRFHALHIMLAPLIQKCLESELLKGLVVCRRNIMKKNFTFKSIILFNAPPFCWLCAQRFFKDTWFFLRINQALTRIDFASSKLFRHLTKDRYFTFLLLEFSPNKDLHLNWILTRRSMREMDDNNNNVVDESGWIGREFISLLIEKSRIVPSIGDWFRLQKKEESLILARIKATHIHHQQRRRGIVRDARLDSLIATSKTFFLPPTRRSSVVLGLSGVSLSFSVYVFLCWACDKNIKRERERKLSKQ